MFLYCFDVIISKIYIFLNIIFKYLQVKNILENNYYYYPKLPQNSTSKNKIWRD